MNKPDVKEGSDVILSLATNERPTIYTGIRPRPSLPGDFNPIQGLRDWKQSLKPEFVAGIRVAAALALISFGGWAWDQTHKPDINPTPTAPTAAAIPEPKIAQKQFGPILAEVEVSTDRYPHELYGAGQLSTPKFRLNYNSPIGWEHLLLSSTDLESGFLLNFRKGDASLTLIQNFLDARIKTFSQHEDIVERYLGFKGKPEGAVMLNRPGYKLKFISGGAYVMIKMVEVDNHGQPEVWQAQYTRRPNSQSIYSPDSYNPNQLLREAEEIMDSFRLDLK